MPSEEYPEYYSKSPGERRASKPRSGCLPAAYNALTLPNSHLPSFPLVSVFEWVQSSSSLVGGGVAQGKSAKGSTCTFAYLTLLRCPPPTPLPFLKFPGKGGFFVERTNFDFSRPRKVELRPFLP